MTDPGLHLSFFVFALFGPLVIYLVFRDSSPFTRHHDFVAGIVFAIMATVAAGRRELYRYPLTIRFVS
jgi:uncharacterized Tic20 family protein